jgi:hypothetical protein
MMQFSIELPDELGQELLQQADVQQFVRLAVEKELSAKKQITQTEQELFSLMAKVPSSVSLVDELIRERRIEAKPEYEENS